MNFDDIQTRALEISKKYDKLNQKKGGAVWDGPQLMAGFVGDVGDLSKIILAKDGLRAMEDVDTKLAHELSDRLWSIIVLARTYDVDLAGEFMNTMDELEKRIDASLKAM